MKTGLKDEKKAEKPSNGNQRRSAKKIVAGAAFVMIGSLCVLGFAQRENLKALYLATTSDPEKLGQKLEEQTQKRDDLLKEYGLESTRPSDSVDTPASSESANAPDGSGTEPPVQQNTQPAEKPADNTAAQGQTAEKQPEKPAKSGELSEDAKKQVQAYVDELYALEDLYLSKLDDIMLATKDEYRALPKEERTKANKIALVKSKTELLIEEEKTCDAEVEAVLSKIQAVLDEEGIKNNLVSDIRARYKDTKATWKAARMTELYK